MTQPLVSLYNWHTITFCQVSDHKNCGQKNDGQTGSQFLDKAVLLQEGGGCLEGVHTPRTHTMRAPRQELEQLLQEMVYP